MEREFKTKDNFIPFNLVWCLGSFFMPFLLMPTFISSIELWQSFLLSIFIYGWRVLKESEKDFLDYRIFVLEEKMAELKQSIKLTPN